MYKIPQAPNVGQIVIQTDFINHFGSFLTHEAGVGLMAYDMAEDGEILYGPVDCETEPLQRIVNIDGSPRQQKVRGIELPELKDIEKGDESKRTPFFADVYMLQKAIEVPLASLMKGWSNGSDRGFSSVSDAAAFRKRIEQFGDMTARQFLAKYNGWGAEEKEGIIKPVAEDIHAAAERLAGKEGGTAPYGCLYNSAVLFAALGDIASHERAANNFFAAARWLFARESFVAAAVLAEMAAEVSRSKEGVELSPEEEDHAPKLERLSEFYSLAADAWHKSLETDLTAETYAFRLYRGMRASWSMLNKSKVDRFLKMASHLSLASADFDKAAGDFMRRAWYGAQRYPMGRQEWAFVRDMINRAVSMWIPLNMAPVKVGTALEFARVAEKMDVEMTLG
jgi:hypothetical protein